MDTSWARTHRARLRFALLTIAIVTFVVYVGVKLYEPPTCFDAKQNQDEVGPDCGGVCEFYCPIQTQPLRVAWAKQLEVAPGWWSAVAYIENPNFDMRADDVPYAFRLYDDAGVLLYERKGTTFVNQEPLFTVFEGRIGLGENTPTRATFEFLATPQWRKVHETYNVTIEQQKHARKSPGEEISVTFYNREPIPLRDAEVVVVVYNVAQEPMASSETYIDYIGPREKKEVTFLWPGNFSETIGRIEFVSRVPVQAE